jgi:hypothetical protein
VEPPATEPEPPPAGTPESPPETGAGVAHNLSTVLQVILQVQRGCQRYCHGTSQLQEAIQQSETTQDASAVGTGENGGAVALNESRTFQFIWQMQLGCVAFCYETTQTQFASQTSQTTQTAEAISAALALALNMSETMQLVWQYQESCREECHGVSATQTVSQAQATDQSAGSTGGSGGPDGVIGWLTALAANIGATLQTIFQFQDADCLENCMGGSQLQRALQQVATLQEATVGDPPAPPAAPPPASTSPSPAPPAETPAADPGAPIARQSSYAERAGAGDGNAPGGGSAPLEDKSRFSSTAPPRPAPDSAAEAVAEAPHDTAATEGVAAPRAPAATTQSGGRSSQPDAGAKPRTHANAPIEPTPLDDLGIKLTEEESSQFADDSLWLVLALLVLSGVFLALGRATQATRT